MNRTRDKDMQRHQGIVSGAKGLLMLQAFTAMLILVNSMGHAGLGKAIFQSLPVLVATGLIAVSVRAAVHENEARARHILSFGVLVVAMSALVALRCN